jgi:hypothetical protein
VLANPKPPVGELAWTQTPATGLLEASVTTPDTVPVLGCAAAMVIGIRVVGTTTDTAAIAKMRRRDGTAVRRADT